MLPTIKFALRVRNRLESIDFAGLKFRRPPDFFRAINYFSAHLVNSAQLSNDVIEWI